MIRLIVIAALVFLLFVSGIAVALHHFFGWKGLIAFPFIALALLWLAKVIVARLIKRAVLGLFSMKSGVLRGAGVEVHSITAVPAPDVETEEDSTDTDSDDEDAAPEEPRHYFAVDMTITPAGGGEENFWEPGELILATRKLTKLQDLEGAEDETGHTEQVEVWTGAEFGPDDPGKYPGAQRIKSTFAVKPGATRVWLHYYSECLGPLDLPAWTPS
jgi:hypothetical protein